MIDTHIEGSEAILEKSKAKLDSLDHFHNAQWVKLKERWQVNPQKAYFIGPKIVLTRFHLPYEPIKSTTNNILAGMYAQTWQGNSPIVFSTVVS